jgi:hypothetical protein
LKSLRTLQGVFLSLTFLMCSFQLGGPIINQHVRDLNGGLMPVVTHSPNDFFAAFNTIAGEQQDGMIIHSLASSRTRWAWPADRFPKYAPTGKIVSTEFFSLGDILFYLGKIQAPFFFGFTIVLFLIEGGQRLIFRKHSRT